MIDLSLVISFISLPFQFIIIYQFQILSSESLSDSLALAPITKTIYNSKYQHEQKSTILFIKKDFSMSSAKKDQLIN